MKMTRPITIVQGGQWGSEAKGAIAAYLCETDAVDYCVRTGATNAGHTVFYKGMPYKMQQLGVGWVNPRTTLILGAGALIDPEILDREVHMVSEATGTDIRKRLIIDHRAGLHLAEHAGRSAASGRHHAIGATGKGCSEALIDRIKGRGKGARLFGQVASAANYTVGDTEMVLNTAWDQGAHILLEGTQGQLLDLYLGPYPYTTHKQTGPAQWMLEAGLSPSLPNEVVAVFRTYPIRVAGNSGPMKGEISWMILAGEINAKRKRAGLPGIVKDESLDVWAEALEVAGRQFPWPQLLGPNSQHLFTAQQRYDFRETLSECNTVAWKLLPEVVAADLSNLFELTTVTKKLRRIARFDTVDYNNSIRQMRPAKIACTFANYSMPQHWYEVPEGRMIDSPIGVPLDFISYGPESKHVVRCR